MGEFTTSAATLKTGGNRPAAVQVRKVEWIIMTAIAKKWVAADFGGPEVLREIDVEVPPPAPGEVTIKVRAAGMNPADYKVFASGTDRSILPLSIGYEVA